MAIKISIQTVANSDCFKFKESPTEFFDQKTKSYELSRNYGTDQDSPKIMVSARNVNNRDYLFTNVAVADIEVDGIVYDTYESLSEVLAPILFKKGGGSGGGGTAGTVITQSPIIGDGLNSAINIIPASGSSRGTMSIADFNKLSGFSQASDYAKTTDLIVLDSNIRTWVNNKDYVTNSNLTANYYTKTEVDGKISGVYRPKGSVADLTALNAITQKQYGDVYNISDTGDNYVWVKDFVSPGVDGWDKLSGTIDLSNYHTIQQYQAWVTQQGYASQSSVNTKEPIISTGSTSQYWRGDKTWQPLNKSAVGLNNVDNTSDTNKPISTATATALGNKLDKNDSTAQTVVSPITFNSTITVPKIILPAQTANTTVGAFWSDGTTVYYNGAGGTSKALLFDGNTLKLSNNTEQTVSSDVNFTGKVKLNPTLTSTLGNTVLIYNETTKGVEKCGTVSIDAIWSSSTAPTSAQLDSNFPDALLVACPNLSPRRIYFRVGAFWEYSTTNPAS